MNLAVTMQHYHRIKARPMREWDSLIEALPETIACRANGKAWTVKELVQNRLDLEFRFRQNWGCYEND